MGGHFELEQKAHRYLRKQREAEETSRPELLDEIRRLRGTDKLPGDYSDKFIEELERTPFDWKVEVFEEGMRFLRDFRYETYFYDMRGWDAARLVVNFDVAKAAVAFRFHAYDSDSDVSIDEGLLVESGRVVSFETETTGSWRYTSHLRSIQQSQMESKGEFGCLFDHLKDELDQLPLIVREMCGGKDAPKFLAAFLKGVEAGEIDINTMPRLALQWPLLQPYHAATT